MTQVVLPGPGREDVSATFSARPVSALDALRRLRRSPVDLMAMFDDRDVISMRFMESHVHIGRSAEWTRHVIGSRAMWADVDTLPLGLGTHPRFFAMGGLPGAPPAQHRVSRRHLQRGGFNNLVTDEVVTASIQVALDLATNPRTRVVDLMVFARAVFLCACASSLVGVRLTADEVRRIVSWFEQVTNVVSSPLVFIGCPTIPITPAGRHRKLITAWYDFLAGLLSREAPDGGLLSTLQSLRRDNDISDEEAIGYLATILFAGTDPPAHTMLWAHSFAVSHDLFGVEQREAEDLLWESIRVSPAVNVVVRRVSAGPACYTSASNDIYLVVPPLTHFRSNQINNLPATFCADAPRGRHLDPDEYPGLGSGAHYCLGSRMGIDVGGRVLAFLLSHRTVTRGPDLRPRGVVTTRPRRMPTVAL